jgi:cell division protein FtsQ
MTRELSEAPPASRTRARVRRALTVALAVAMLALALGANDWKRGLAIREVRTYGNSILSANDVAELAHVDRNQKLFSVDLNAVRRRVEANPYVRSASVTRDAPGCITIAVRERVPVAALLADRRLYIDDSACVLPVLRPDQLFDLPSLTGALPAAECVPGHTMKTPALREALALLSAARAIGDDLYHTISEVHIAGDGDLFCYTAESGVPVLFGQGNVPEKLVKFDSFWKDYVARDGVQDLQYVDLRFEDQVVARWNRETVSHERTSP